MAGFIKSNTNQSGMSLVEILVALSIMSILGITGGLAVNKYVQLRSELLQESSRLYAAEGGMEMVRFVRDADWESIASVENDTPYYLEVSTSSIALVPDTQVDVWGTRTVVFSSVYRDVGENIVPAGEGSALVDEASRKVFVSVSDGTGTSTLRSLLVDLFQP